MRLPRKRATFSLLAYDTARLEEAADAAAQRARDNEAGLLIGSYGVCTRP